MHCSLYGENKTTLYRQGFVICRGPFKAGLAVLIYRKPVNSLTFLYCHVRNLSYNLQLVAGDQYLVEVEGQRD
jgi:hypothetical protein